MRTTTPQSAWPVLYLVHEYGQSRGRPRAARNTTSRRSFGVAPRPRWLAARSCSSVSCTAMITLCYGFLHWRLLTSGRAALALAPPSLAGPPLLLHDGLPGAEDGIFGQDAAAVQVSAACSSCSSIRFKRRSSVAKVRFVPRDVASASAPLWPMALWSKERCCAHTRTSRPLAAQRTAHRARTAGQARDSIGLTRACS